MSLYALLHIPPNTKFNFSTSVPLNHLPALLFDQEMDQKFHTQKSVGCEAAKGVHPSNSVVLANGELFDIDRNEERRLVWKLDRWWVSHVASCSDQSILTHCLKAPALDGLLLYAVVHG
jgi:hypothetical protein